MTMGTLGEALQRFRSAGEALPDESQCPTCGYFDVTHPDVRRILLDRDPAKLKQAACRCQSQEAIVHREAEKSAAS